MNQMLSTKQLAEELGVSERTVRRMALSGQLKQYRIGTAIRYRRRDVESFLAEQAVIPPELLGVGGSRFRYRPGMNVV